MEEAEVFENCPEYQSEHFQLRKMEMQDVEGLFQCYSNPEAAATIFIIQILTSLRNAWNFGKAGIRQRILSALR